MARYSPSVERWRALLERYFAPEDVDKALYVMQGESGGDPMASGDGGASIGLFQLNDDGLGSGMSARQRLDPETNIRVAADAVYGGSGWRPWGEGVTYKGKRFGVLGARPYRGPTEPSEPTEPGSLPTGDMADDIEKIMRIYLDGAPRPEDFEDALEYSVALQTWSGTIKELSDVSRSLRQSEQGIIELPDGTVIPKAGANAEMVEAVNRSNLNVYRSILNRHNLDAFDRTLGVHETEVTRRSKDFANRIQGFGASVDFDEAARRRAENEIDRHLKGLAEARSRADLVTRAQQEAAPWATSGGKTLFTGADLGAGVTSLLGSAGVPNPAQATAIAFPGYRVIDPLAIIREADAAFGVGGPLPAMPQMITKPGALPQAPDLPAFGGALPELLPPVPSGEYSYAPPPTRGTTNGEAGQDGYGYFDPQGRWTTTPPLRRQPAFGGTRTAESEELKRQAQRKILEGIFR